MQIWDGCFPLFICYSPSHETGHHFVSLDPVEPGGAHAVVNWSFSIYQDNRGALAHLLSLMLPHPWPPQEPPLGPPISVHLCLCCPHAVPAQPCSPASLFLGRVCPLSLPASQGPP